MSKIIIGTVLAIVIIGGLFFFIQRQYQPSQQLTQPPQTKVETNTIIIKNLSFNPDSLTIKPGTKITWINEDLTSHNVKSDTFNSLDLNQQDKFEFTFKDKGSFDYICGIHPLMKGEIIVE